MEILFAIVIGAGIGAVLRFIVPKRHAHGLLLVPLVGAIVTAAFWAPLVWLGFTFDGTWIWVLSLVAGGLASLLVALLAPVVREREDAARFERLRRA